MTPAAKLTAAGFVATAVAFGPARMGFGLFLPSFREAFALTTSTAGLTASGGFLAFLLALVASAWLGRRHGERVPVVVGALAASAGFLTVAAAAEPGLLALGIALSGASAGLCWAPFNDAAERVRSLDEHSTGTMKEYLSLTRLEEDQGYGMSGESMVMALLHDHEVIIRQLRQDLQKCGELGDEGNMDFLTALMEMHEKMAWMLRATLG